MPPGGGPAVLIAGRAADEQSLPDKEGLRAFLLDSSVGYGLHAHTWHSLDRMPIQDQTTRWVMFTDHKTHDDLPLVAQGTRSEERRVGREDRSRGARDPRTKTR